MSHKPACAEPCSLQNECSCTVSGGLQKVMTPDVWRRYHGFPEKKTPAWLFPKFYSPTGNLLSDQWAEYLGYVTLEGVVQTARFLLELRESRVIQSIV